MGNIRNLSAISSSDAVFASPMTNNFSQAVVAINSSALNSDNYAQTSIKSQHVQPNAILSQHISAGAVPIAKFSSNCIVHDNFGYIRANSGVDFIHMGNAASNMPANGMRLGHYSFTAENTSNVSVLFTVTWSDALHGNPAFTTTPYFLGQPTFQVHSTSGTAPVACYAHNIGSASVGMGAILLVTTPQSFTVFMDVAGPV